VGEGVEKMTNITGEKISRDTWISLVDALRRAEERIKELENNVTDNTLAITEMALYNKRIEKLERKTGLLLDTMKEDYLKEKLTTPEHFRDNPNCMCGVCGTTKTNKISNKLVEYQHIKAWETHPKDCGCPFCNPPVHPNDNFTLKGKEHFTDYTGKEVEFYTKGDVAKAKAEILRLITNELNNEEKDEEFVDGWNCGLIKAKNIINEVL
jgi:hypothetical protein